LVSLGSQRWGHSCSPGAPAWVSSCSSTTAPGPSSTRVVPSDADGDGDVDILAALRVGQERHVGVYLNDGTGAFGAPVTYPLGLATDRATPIQLVHGDLNGDGADDVVATDIVEIDLPEGGRQTDTVAMVALNDGTGAFTATGSPFRIGYPGAVFGLTPALADFDEDGHLDLTVGGPGGVNIAMGDGTGGFGEPVATSSAPGGYDLIVPGDIDSDGHADLVGFNSLLDPKNATIVYGDGQGGVADTHGVGTGTNVGGDGTVARMVELADIDRDGDPDILFLAGSLGVLENVKGRPTH
jgi:hypothetical protein